MATLGQLADKLAAKRDKLEEAKAIVAGLESEASAIEDEIIRAMKKEGIAQIKGNYCTISVQEVVKKIVEDWDKFYRFVATNKAYYLFQRRLHEGAYEELLTSRNGKDVPGIGEYKRDKIRVTKSQS